MFFTTFALGGIPHEEEDFTMAYNALDVARKVIAATNEAAGDTITNLKLQKLLYYLQGHWLATFDGPLFGDRIEAWEYGPVVPSVYSHFAVNRGNPIDVGANGGNLALGTRQEDALFYSIYAKYADYSASALMRMTHGEAPWIAAWSVGQNAEISLTSIKQYFKSKQMEEREDTEEDYRSSLAAHAGVRKRIMACGAVLQYMRTMYGVPGLFVDGETEYTARMVADFYGVPPSVLHRCVETHREELRGNGYVEATHGGEDECTLGTFSFSALINVGMLLDGSRKAKEVRCALLDAYIEQLNERVGGGTRYVSMTDSAWMARAEEMAKYMEHNDADFMSVVEMNRDIFLRLKHAGNDD